LTRSVSVSAVDFHPSITKWRGLAVSPTCNYDSQLVTNLQLIRHQSMWAAWATNWVSASRAVSGRARKPWSGSGARNGAS